MYAGLSFFVAGKFRDVNSDGGELPFFLFASVGVQPHRETL